MNRRWNLILLVIVSVLSGWFYSLQPSDDQLKQLIKNEKSPEYTGTQMKTVVFSLQGKPQYIANAASVEYYDKEDYSIFKEPTVYLFDIEKAQTEFKNWKISADQAKLTKDDKLYLNGNVLANSLVTNSKIKQITTENATVNLKSQDITADSTVNILGSQFNSSGKKLIGNLKKQVATLQEQVKTHYEIINQ